MPGRGGQLTSAAVSLHCPDLYLAEAGAAGPADAGAPPDPEADAGGGGGGGVAPRAAWVRFRDLTAEWWAARFAGAGHAPGHCPP